MPGTLQIEFREVVIGGFATGYYHSYLAYKEDNTNVWEALHCSGPDGSGNIDAFYTPDLQNITWEDQRGDSISSQEARGYRVLATGMDAWEKWEIMKQHIAHIDNQGFDYESPNPVGTWQGNSTIQNSNAVVASLLQAVGLNLEDLLPRTYVVGGDTITIDKEDDDLPGYANLLSFNWSLTGTINADTIFGYTGNDTLSGDLGNDLLDGKAGSDSLVGGDGYDTIHGYHGNDYISGGNHNDLLLGEEGSDYILGGEGADTLAGNTANDTMDGGNGNDSVNGEQDSDSVSGGAGNDTVNGGSGNDYANGGTGNDTVDGGYGFDTLYGGDGADSIFGDSDEDILYGEAGADSVLLAVANDNNTSEAMEFIRRIAI